jgi:internalin A
MSPDKKDMPNRAQDTNRESEEKHVSSQGNHTEVGSAEMVVSGPHARININKANPQDFIDIYEYAQKQKREQVTDEMNACLEKLPPHSEAASKPIRSGTFISYSRADAKYLDELHNHLAPYVRAGKINFWDDTKILPGSRWSDEISKALQSAKVAVFLVSAEFLASSFIARRELPPLLHAAEHEGAVILSVILRPCAFQISPLSAFQSINAPSEPLCDMKVGRRNKVWLKLAEQIKNALEL